MNNKIGALWINENGEKRYLSGTIEINGSTHKIVVFKNNFKEKDAQPDYNILLKSEKSAQVKNVQRDFEDDVPF